MFAYAAALPVSGSDFMHAFILGFEAEMRIGNAVYPAHYDVGWHITGTAGVFGAAIAIGKLLGLPLQEMIWAMGLAATQAAGIREMFGSMAKAFHPGRSAQNGYSAALLAQAGFTAGERGLEGPRGFAAVQAAAYDLSKITAGLGSRLRTSLEHLQALPVRHREPPHHRWGHPAPSGIPRGSGCYRRGMFAVAPLVLDLCNQTNITRGLQGKFSVYHGAAIGLVRGKAGIQEYTDEAVNDPDIKRVRELATAVGDPSITEDQAHIEVKLSTGETLTRFVEKSLGNIHRPLTDRQLEDKFRDQGVLALPLLKSNSSSSCAGASMNSPTWGNSPGRLYRPPDQEIRWIMIQTMRKLWLFFLLATIASAEVSEVRIPTGAGGVGFLPLLVMEKYQLIEKHAQAAGVANLHVRWIKLGGPSVMNDALLSGSADFIAAGPPAFLTLWDRTLASVKVKGVAAMTSLPMYLDVRSDRLKTLDDFTDKDKIAVTAIKVSIPALIMQMYARQKYGPAQTARFDKYTVTMTHPDAVVALLSGSGAIDAHFTSPPFHQRELKDPRVHTILTTTGVMGGSTTFTMLSTTSRFREQNPKVYAAVLAALEEANQRILSDKPAAAAILLASTNDKSFSVQEIAAVLSDPAIKLTTTPENVMKYATFMADIGSIKTRPGSWKDLFFPEIHGAPGS